MTYWLWAVVEASVIVVCDADGDVFDEKAGEAFEEKEVCVAQIGV